MWQQVRLSESLEDIVGMAVCDPEFAMELLRDPLATVATAGVELNPEETRVLLASAGDTLVDWTMSLMCGWSEFKGVPMTLEQLGAPSQRSSRQAERSTATR